MANECLVTKLKGVVDNNDLLKYGELTITVTNTDALDYCIHLQCHNVNDVEVTGPNITEIPNVGVARRYKLGISATPYKIKISNYYKLCGITYCTSTGAGINETVNHHMNFDDWEKVKYIGYLTARYNFNILPTENVDADIKNLAGFPNIIIQPDGNAAQANKTKLVGNISDIAIATASNIVLQNSTRYLTGDISAFAICTVMNSLKLNWDTTFSSGQRNAITGDIASLSPCLALGGDVNLSGTNIYGTIESLVEGQIEAGRQAGTQFDFVLAITNDVTLNGQHVNPGWCRILFTSTGAQIVNRATPSTIYADYNKTTGVWTYSNL